MNSTRELANRYADLLCSQKFGEAFDMLSPKARYRIIGTTPVSAPMEGRDQVKATLLPALASCREPPKLTLQEIIVDGDRAVVLAQGRGIGPTGIVYDQPHYAMVLRIEDGRIVDVVEFADTVAIEVALVGKKLVPA